VLRLEQLAHEALELARRRELALRPGLAVLVLRDRAPAGDEVDDLRLRDVDLRAVGVGQQHDVLPDLVLVQRRSPLAVDELVEQGLRAHEVLDRHVARLAGGLDHEGPRQLVDLVHAMIRRRLPMPEKITNTPIDTTTADQRKGFSYFLNQRKLMTIPARP
jgi:hypothetical protein